MCEDVVSTSAEPKFKLNIRFFNLVKINFQIFTERLKKLLVKIMGSFHFVIHPQKMNG